MKPQVMVGGSPSMGKLTDTFRRKILREPSSRQISRLMLSFALASVLCSCSGRQPPAIETPFSVLPADAETEALPETNQKTNQTQLTAIPSDPVSADVLEVSVTGNPGAYTFSVTIRSPDTGCNLYANWWEVLSQEGRLLYRRILLHSHVNEQPFTRSGSPTPIQPNQTVIVRAHMHPSGYGGSAQQGTVAAGFKPVNLPADFAAAVAAQSPQPSGCNF